MAQINYQEQSLSSSKTPGGSKNTSYIKKTIQRLSSKAFEDASKGIKWNKKGRKALVHAAKERERRVQEELLLIEMDLKAFSRRLVSDINRLQLCNDDCNTDHQSKEHIVKRRKLLLLLNDPIEPESDTESHFSSVSSQ